MYESIKSKNIFKNFDKIKKLHVSLKQPSVRNKVIIKTYVVVSNGV